MTDTDHESTLEARDLRKLMIEVAQRMSTLKRVHQVMISFDIKPTPAGDFKLISFTATKELPVD